MTKAAQILQWWEGVEQGSIKMALDYAYVFHADITDCYAAIYTHSIAWAIHSKAIAKANQTDMSLIGNHRAKGYEEGGMGRTGIP